ncbi:MAG TPA: hypothetical protein VKV73_22410 [Chloroflexota bacterium]|nr:hypothetical protein [Chloroflexota bacterium]
MGKARSSSPRDVLLIARDISDSVQVGGLKTVAAAFALDPATGMILGSGMAADAAGAVRDLLTNVSAAANGPKTPRLLCPPELLSMVEGGLPASWRKAEVAAVQPGCEVEDLFDSLVGHLADREQPSDLPSPADWSMLFRQALAFVEAAPWRHVADHVRLQMDLRLGGTTVERVGIILGNGGVTYGFALYPADAKPTGGTARFDPMAPPPGTLAMTLDPASALPGYLVAKARRYQWPDSLALLPVFFAWTGDGAADLSTDEVALLAMGLAAALAGQRTAPTAGDMILSGGRSGHYHVALSAPARVVDTGDFEGLTIDRALQEFLDGCRSRLSARTVRTYESVIDLLRACLNSYGYQYLTEAEHDAVQAAYEAGDEQAFCNLVGAEKIAESVGEFLGYFMIRKVAASGELLRASGTVMGKLVAWLAERGELSQEAAYEAQQRARAAAHDLPRAARLAEILFDTVESAPRVNVDRLDDEDYVEDELTISRVAPERIWFEDDLGPVKVPKAASDLARAGWTVSLALGRVRGQWRIVEVGGVYP